VTDSALRLTCVSGQGHHSVLHLLGLHIASPMQTQALNFGALEAGPRRRHSRLVVRRFAFATRNHQHTAGLDAVHAVRLQYRAGFVFEIPRLDGLVDPARQGALPCGCVLWPDHHQGIVRVTLQLLKSAFLDFEVHVGFSPHSRCYSILPCAVTWPVTSGPP
jgi:hypothetical protein